MAADEIEVTVLTKDGGILSKRISLSGGAIKSDASECLMARGRADRRPIGSVEELATLIESLEPRQALTLGRMRPGLASTVRIVPKAKVNGAGGGVYARTAENFIFEPGRPAYVLLDHDTKGMPASVKEKLAAAGSFWEALVKVCLGLSNSARLLRSSTSAGLRRSDTGEEFVGSGGLHVYLQIRDGSDVRRFLETLHDRCWLAGLGWFGLSKVGSYRDMSIIDVSVGAPERLVFEGAPIVEPPLEQDSERRRPVATPGATIDTFAACPPLTTSEAAEVGRLKGHAKQALAGERAKLRGNRARTLASERGITVDAARRIVDSQCERLLLSSQALEFDDAELADKTVADVLDNPVAFENETLADPLDGADEGRCKAKVMIGDDGVPFINSFAHGGVRYKLRYDAAAVEKRVREATENVVETFVGLVLRAELGALDLHYLIEVVAGRTNHGVNPIKAAINEARRERATRSKEEAKERRRAERNDRRPELLRQPNDSPLTEEMARINKVIKDAPLEQQLRRDLYGKVVKPRWKPVPNTHAFSGEDGEEAEAPEQWTIGRLDEFGLTEEIERLMNYVDEEVRSVTPPRRLVKAYTSRDDQVLHVLSAIATLPIVLADGVILGRESGFEPTRGIHFMVPEAIATLVPRAEDCGPETVAQQMHFLTDDWLVDVKTNYAGKCVAIAEVLTIIERSLLPERPVFGYTAGKSGSGKTTLIKMIVAAATGHLTAASAWTEDENERRKSIMAYFMSGVSYILWDNIPRGFQISCPHIERSCTSAYCSDRILGVSETVATAATTIHTFTGNNIGFKGDLAARALECKLDADRSDPENREFAHSDPIDWTLKNRDKVLRALFTILLGNPMLKERRDAAMKTRFKTWSRLVGSAVENAAAQAVAARVGAATIVSFEKLFLSQRDDDEEDSSLGEVLFAMEHEWGGKDEKGQVKEFEAKQVADVINNPQQSVLKTLLEEFLFEAEKLPELVSAKAVGKRLARHVGNVVRWDGRPIVLKAKKETAGDSKGVKKYQVEFLDGKPGTEGDETKKPF